MSNVVGRNDRVWSNLRENLETTFGKIVIAMVLSVKGYRSAQSDGPIGIDVVFQKGYL